VSKLEMTSGVDVILYSDALGHEQERKHSINLSDHFRCKKYLISGCRVPVLMPLFCFVIVEVMIVCQQFTWHSQCHIGGCRTYGPDRRRPNKLECHERILHRLLFSAAPRWWRRHRRSWSGL
jgi:hypothetical protein